MVQFPIGKRALQSKWDYNLKEEDGGKKRYKDRLVLDGFVWMKGIYFEEVFSIVVKMNLIKTILSLVETEYLHPNNLDVNITFLHRYLKEEIYM